jgi:two-component system phosphate regulon response regulator PhoB
MAAADILLVEDEEEAATLLKGFLEYHHYQVHFAADGNAGLELLEAHAQELQLAVLDIMLPGKDGRALLQHIRQHPVLYAMPVIFLTAKDQEADEIQGLEMGADDYITKPASLNRLLARVQTLLRRHEPQSAGAQRLQVGGVELDRNRRSCRVGGQEITLTQTEYNLLLLFFRHPNQVFNREQIIEHISSDEKPIFDRTVDAHIKNLRVKLGEQGEMIKTFRGMGYGLAPSNQEL